MREILYLNGSNGRIKEQATNERQMKKILLCSLGLFASTSHATNGINLIGFGAESTLMAGADIAVARDTSALNTNPAGLTQIHHQRFDAYGSLLRITDYGFIARGSVW